MHMGKTSRRRPQHEERVSVHENAALNVLAMTERLLPGATNLEDHLKELDAHADDVVAELGRRSL